MTVRDRQPRAAGRLLALAAVLTLAACAAPRPGEQFNDPYEARNRAVHEFNKSVDSAVFGGGAGKDEPSSIPKPLTNMASNFAANLGEPGSFLNHMLQGKPVPAAQNVLRFSVNTVAGVGGLFDAASAIGLPPATTDFGATLHTWGAPEGAYIEAPILGPTTERDLAGTVVDIFIDPVNHALDWPDVGRVNAARLVGKAAQRLRFSATANSILYDSADSYAQARLLYLQNRHFELGIEEDQPDPFEDPNAN